MSKKRRRGDNRQNVTKPPAQAPWSVAEWMLVAGTLGGAFGTSLAFLPLGGTNPFGPAKALVLSCACVLVMLGLALDADSRARVWSLVRGSWLAWAAAGLLGLAALATVTALSPAQAIAGGLPDYRGLLSACGYGIIGLGAIAVWARPGGTTLVARTAVVAAAVVSLFGLLQLAHAVPGGPDGTRSWRVASLLGNASNLGLFVLAVLPLVVLAALAEESRAWRVSAILASAGAVWLLLLTQSRGAWLGALVVLIGAAVTAVAARKQASGRRKWLAIGLAGLALLALVSVVAVPSLRVRASTLLDTRSRTAQWRLSAWESATQMSLARPFLGYGPDNFRYAYPPFQAAGQVDGARGYQVVEAAHNLELDTAASFGLMGLAALVGMVALVAVSLLRQWRAGPERRPIAIALAASLLGMLVGLQFHYVTMDLGALAGLLLGGVVAFDPRSAMRAETSPESVRWAAWSGAALYAAAAMAVLLAFSADVTVGRAIDAASTGAPWATVSAQTQAAAKRAPWEPQVRRATGTAATVVLLGRPDAQAARDGEAALDEVIATRSLDVVLASERANLLLAAGIGLRDRAMLERAADAFGEVEAMDPGTGIAPAGRAAALLSLGRAQESIPVFESALKRSPRYRLGWTNLARAYDAVGRKADAQKALKHASGLRR